MDQSFKLSDGYKNWAAFVEEFRRIEESLQESKSVERLLIARSNQLKSELVASGEKLHTVMSVRAEDERTMALLRKECDHSVATMMDAKLKEKKAMALVSGLQADIEALQAQVGVLQNALWLERERANAAVKASRSAISVASKAKTNAGSMMTKIMMNPSSPASVAAAEAAATAAGALAASSRGGRGGGSSSRRRLGFPSKRAGGAAGTRAVHRGPSGRPSTASAATFVPPCAHINRRRTPTSSGSRGLYGEDSSEFWGGGGDEEPRIGQFVLDLDSRRGYACDGVGGPADEVGRSGGEVITPFQKWKNDRGITSPAVADIFAGQGGCGS